MTTHLRSARNRPLTITRFQGLNTMKCSMLPSRRMFIVCISLTLEMCAAQNVWADNPKSSGVIHFSDKTKQQATFTLGGTDKHIGRFTSYGELDFVPGAAEGTLDGTGVVVLTAANGDRLVGVATAQLDANSS